MTTKQQEKMVRRCEREWRAAVRREETAADVIEGWKLAQASDRAKRRLDMARAGIEPEPPRTRRNLAKAALGALATIGKVIARSAQAAGALAKARAAKLARSAGYLARQAMRRAVSAVARRAATCAHDGSAWYDTHDRPVCIRCGAQLTPAQVVESLPTEAVAGAAIVVANRMRAMDHTLNPLVRRQHRIALDRALNAIADAYGVVDVRVLFDVAFAEVAS